MNKLAKNEKKVAEIFAEYFDDNQNRDEESDKTQHPQRKHRKPSITKFETDEGMLDEVIKLLRSTNTNNDPYGMTMKIIN